MKVVALAGGVGAARFLRGLVVANRPSDVTVIGNTGDDAVIHGVHVSPDLDIVCYNLAGIAGPRGWGLSGDTAQALDQMRRLGGPSWFMLGDRDLGTHLTRTAWLSEGIGLSEITRRIRTALGVQAEILPMSDETVRTKLITAEGVERDFQDYFVRFGHAEDVTRVFFEGAQYARPAPGVIEAVHAADRIVVCPSNPLLSIGPILAVPGIRPALAARRKDVFAISPIIQGKALKGPADRLLPLWSVEASSAGVARLYADLCGNFVLDRLDAGEENKIGGLEMNVVVTNTIMENDRVAAALAEVILSYGSAMQTESSSSTGVPRGPGVAGKPPQPARAASNSRP